MYVFTYLCGLLALWSKYESRILEWIFGMYMKMNEVVKKWQKMTLRKSARFI